MKTCKFCCRQFSNPGFNNHSKSCKLAPYNVELLINELKMKFHKHYKPKRINPLLNFWVGRKHTEESKKKISESMKGNTRATHRGDRQSYYKGIRMDSKWEVGAARYFDNNSIVWKYSEYGYTLSDGRVYYPDFFIYENDSFVKLVEVKGYFRPANKLKFEMFIREYPHIKIELWEKQKLRQLGIITNEGYLNLTIEEHYLQKPKFEYICSNCSTIFYTNTKRESRFKYCSRNCQRSDGKNRLGIKRGPYKPRTLTEVK